VKRFPEGFVFGAATSSYQIEGSAHEDGRGESIWDRFAATPGAIVDGSSGAVACDHYRLFARDVALMQRLGLQAYRFSIAWPRVLPDGRRGHVEERGLDFYERLVDALLAAGVAPVATLYHWDLPQALEERGGWPTRDTALAFVDYVDVVTRRLGDRVKTWITHNEPWCISVLGYADGHHAPGRRSWPDALAAAHHLLLSHGMAVDVIRAACPGAEVGITLNLTHVEAASPSAADEEACREVDGVLNRWYLDPLFGKGYPEDVAARHRADGHLPAGELPFLRTGDLELMARPIDLLGVNYYSRAIARSRRVSQADNAPQLLHPSGDATDMGWEVHPEGLHQLLCRLHRDYAPARILITENGAAYDTPPGPEGRIPDAKRIAYLHGHLDATLRAHAAGVPVSGYFVWSLLDNFEWAHGYAKRFGIVWVDYQTQERIPKESAWWYRAVIQSHALPESNP
jgi:beta-glucosidase